MAALTGEPPLASVGRITIRLLGPPPLKLIVQIPCFNNEATLPQTVADIPRHIDGVEPVRVGWQQTPGQKQ